MNTEDYQAIVDLTAEAFNSSSLPVRMRNIRGGGYASNYFITLPLWLREQVEIYQIYYCVHEICHHIAGQHEGHSSIFKNTENSALALWGITIKRAKVYPRVLYLNGEKKYTRL